MRKRTLFLIILSVITVLSLMAFASCDGEEDNGGGDGGGGDENGGSEPAGSITLK